MLPVMGVPLHPFKQCKKVQISLKSGECLWLKGKNGSGKTTVLTVLAGQIHVRGLVVPTAVQYISAKPLTLKGLTVKEQLAYYQKIYQNTFLTGDWVRGFEDMPVLQLSQGQSQRLSLLRLGFSHDPLWLLDEPFNALDLEGVELLNQLLDQHIMRGGGVIYSSHIKMRSGCEVLCLDS